MLFKGRKSFDAKKHGLAFLNLTQFSVVLVDNIFKLIIAFFLIDIGGKDSASQILAAVGAELKPNTIAVLDELIAAEKAKTAQDSN